MPAQTSPRTISVTGTGRVLIRPDLADVRLGVTVTTRTVEAARSADVKAMISVIDALNEIGIAERDIQTVGLSLSPAYDYSTNRNPRLTGYTLTNTVAVTIRDIELVGRAIDGALKAGATSLDSFAFRIQDPSATEREAREAAVADARAKADVLAAAAGVSITGVAAISESGSPVPYPVFRGEMAKMALADTSTPIEPGANEVSITVTITYLIS